MKKNVSLLYQLIAGFSAIIIIILSVTSYFFYRNASEVVLEKTSQYLLESVIQMRGKTDVLLREYDRLSQMIAFNPEIQRHFQAVKRDSSPPSSLTDIASVIANQSQYSVAGLSILLMDWRGDLYSGNNSLTLFWRTEDDIKQNPWYSEVSENRGRVMWLSGWAWRNGKIPAVVGARQLNSWSSLEKLGDMFIVFPLDLLSRVIEEVSLDQSRKIHIIDQLGQIVYSTRSEEAGQQIDDKLWKSLSGAKTNIIYWTLNDIPTYVVYSSSDYSGWTVVAYIEPEAAVKDLKAVRQSIIMIGLFGIAAALLFTTFFSWSLVKPIRYLALRLGQVERGRLTPYEGKMKNREVEILYNSFNNMLEHLNRSIKDLSEKQISEKRAQIIALKAQFRPHFLYNSLNTIYWVLISEGQEKIAHMVLTLSDLLRYSIQPGSEMVTIREDLDQLQRFMLLQQARFGEKLQMELHVDPELLEERIMKMLLQPLVENAITHGVESVKGRPWIIRVDLRNENHCIQIMVEDNGKGMAPEEMHKVLEFRSDADEGRIMHSGLGLANLHYRIGLIYGKEYGIRLKAGALGGLRVEIDLPLEWREKHASQNDFTAD